MSQTNGRPRSPLFVAVDGGLIGLLASADALRAQAAGPLEAQREVGGGVNVARENAHVALLEGNLWQILRAIDIAREAVHLIEQNWTLIVYPNTAAILLSLPGLIGPVGATLISNGSALLATLNAL